MKTSLSPHSRERIKERAHLPKSAHHKAAETAWQSGHRAASYSGSFRRFLDGMALEHHNTPVVWSQRIWIFSTEGVLITILNLPARYRGVQPKNL